MNWNIGCDSVDEKKLFCGFVDVLGFSNIINDWEKAKEYYEIVVKGIFYGCSKMEQMMHEQIINFSTNKDNSIKTSNGSETLKYRIISDSYIGTSEDPILLIKAISSIQSTNTALSNDWNKSVEKKSPIKNIELLSLDLPNLEDEIVPENPVDIPLNLYQMEKTE